MQTFTATIERSIPQNAARRIFGLIRSEMDLVELEFQRQASSNVQVINYLGDYIRSSGGKRVRPALLVLANYAVGGNGSAEFVLGHEGCFPTARRKLRSSQGSESGTG